MTALVIGAEQRADIARLRVLAADNVIDASTVAALKEGHPAAFNRHMAAHSTALPFGYVVCFTHELQPKAPPPGLCAHISISVIHDNMLPSPAAVDVILQEFGMPPRRDCAAAWIEDVAAGTRAVNLVALLPG